MSRPGDRGLSEVPHQQSSRAAAAHRIRPRTTGRPRPRRRVRGGRAVRRVPLRYRRPAARFRRPLFVFIARPCTGRMSAGTEVPTHIESSRSQRGSCTRQIATISRLGAAFSIWSSSKMLNKLFVKFNARFRPSARATPSVLGFLHLLKDGPATLGSKETGSLPVILPDSAPP